MPPQEERKRLLLKGNVVGFMRTILKSGEKHMSTWIQHSSKSKWFNVIDFKDDIVYDSYHRGCEYKGVWLYETDRIKMNGFRIPRTRKDIEGFVGILCYEDYKWLIRDEREGSSRVIYLLNNGAEPYNPVKIPKARKKIV